MITKQQRWDRSTEEFTHMADKLGKPIDQGILETVIVLNLLEVKTVQSCEGHMEWGVAAPWIDIEPSVPKQVSDTQFKNADEMFKKAIEIEKIPHNGKKAADMFALSRTMFDEARKPLRELYAKCCILFNQFYSGRAVSYDRILTCTHYARRLRLESIGAFLQPINEPSIKKPKLVEYQDEMKEFTAFLKKIYFSE